MSRPTKIFQHENFYYESLKISRFTVYRSVPGKRPLPGKHLCMVWGDSFATNHRLRTAL